MALGSGLFFVNRGTLCRFKFLQGFLCLSDELLQRATWIVSRLCRDLLERQHVCRLQRLLRWYRDVRLHASAPPNSCL